MADVQPGTVVTIASDIVANGVLTFAGGEQVTVQQVAPNPQMPEYKYTVQSSRTGTWYQLRDADIIVGSPQAAPPQPQYATPPPQPGARTPRPGAQKQPRAGGGVDFSTMELSDWLVGIGGVVMFIGTFFYWWGFGFLFPLLGLGLIALVVLDKIAAVPAVSDWPYLAWVYIIVGGLSTLLGGLSLIRILFWLHGLISISWYFTPVLELLASIAVLVCGVMKARESM